MTLVLTALLKLLMLDLVFLTVMLALVVLLARGRRVAYAVLKRNFFGYFANPTGYVFLCLFVLLTSMAAFWPDEFFSSNLGTLGQLNKWFAYIMMFFIPAITMSIWAEEKRQGTDELLLTLPADDFDIVAGKYVAASAIYTVSLLFSQLSTFMVLALLTQGEIDTGLFFSNYLGYWFIGLAMISIGMVASFLTSNLTVGFILGALFNAPLAFAFIFDNIVSFFAGAGANRSLTREIKSFGIQERFDDFGRGVLSLSSMSYFLLISTFGVYLCMVLIGKRHWSGGRNGNAKLAHFLARIALLALLAIAGSMLFRNKDRRTDVTENQVSSLSPVSKEMIRSLGRDRDIVVDAYISDEVPEQYAKIKYEIVSVLKEFESTAKSSGVGMQVRIYDSIRPSSDEEKMAEQQYGIVPQMISVREKGTYSDQPVLLGAAVRSGLQKVVIPFFEPGVPVEYELVRSLTTVAKPARKKLGVLKTDAKMMGGMDMRSFQSQPQHPIVEELSKQYEVSEVNPSSPIDTEKYDVMLAVQPSSLGPEEMINFTAAVIAGVPTAIFEDPVVVAFEGGIPGTGDPKQAGGGMMGMMGGGGPQPKGDIRPLWRALGIEVPGQLGMQGGFSPDLCWQEYNPYPILSQTSQATDLWIFASESAPYAEDALSESSEITKGLKEIMFLYAGVILPAKESAVKFSTLVKTGQVAGNMRKSDIDSIQRSGLSRSTELRIRRGKTQGEQILAALLEGEEAKEGATSTRPIKAVYVTDIDCMSEVFVNIRNKKAMMEDINFQFQNVTFILNTIDVLVGETRYPQVRRHVPTYSTLKMVELKADEARREEVTKQTEYQSEYTKAVANVEDEIAASERGLKEEIEKLQNAGSIDQETFKKLQEKAQIDQIKKAQMAKKFKVEKDRLERTRDQGIREARRQSDDSIGKIQLYYKLLAVFIPPIPPLVVGIIVMVSRRLRERDGISKARLR